MYWVFRLSGGGEVESRSKNGSLITCRDQHFRQRMDSMGIPDSDQDRIVRELVQYGESRVHVPAFQFRQIS
jgi:hypothetical protein